MSNKTVLILHHSAPWLCEQLAQEVPQYDYRACKSADEAMAHAADAAVLCALAPQIPERLVAAMPGLEWIHALTTGTDNLMSMPALSQDVAISNSRGMHGPQMAEMAVLLMMALARRLPEVLANQAKHVWERWPQPLLLDKTVCIVGLGVIAEALAQRCAPFGMRITGVSDGRAEVPGFACIFPRSRMAEAAADADFVVVLVPYSPQTHHLVGKRVLAAMKPTACLLNIARGGCVDEAAVTAHLREGKLAGAALDVFATEPLPADSPLWDVPNLIVTPHIGGMSDIYHQQVLPILAENLRAYAEGGAAALPHRVARH